MSDEYNPIELVKLKPGTVLLLETENEVYEIKITGDSGKEATIVGGPTFHTETEILITGSFCAPGKQEKPGQRIPGIIQKDMCIELMYWATPRSRKVTTISTTPVKSCKMIGPNNEWKLEVWED